MSNAPLGGVHDGVAIIPLDNPPVNGLAHTVRRGIADALERALADPRVRSIVILGEGKLFSGGADIREFNTPAAVEKPTLREVIQRVETSSKPVIAALHGGAYGGGLELAMSCHYRVASASTRLALPEVKLGLLPGAGGTQRLPRLIGPRAALAMIVSGDPIDAGRACELGLVDEIVDGALLDGAVAFADRVWLHSTHPLASRREASGLPHAVDSNVARELFAAARAEVESVSPGFRAPLECIACVEASLVLSFDDGLVFERERFNQLVAGAQSNAMRYLFFAERQASKATDPAPAPSASRSPVADTDATGLASDLLAASGRLAGKIGKNAPLVRATEELVGQRLLTSFRREVEALIAEDVSAHRIECALRDFGVAPGSLMGGGRIEPRARSQQRIGIGASPDEAAPPIGDADIVDRAIHALSNEGARMLEDGTAMRASDIDLVCVHGFGFPAWRGGPMFDATC